MAFGHNPALLIRVEECRHRRHVERAPDAVFGQQVEDPRNPDPVAELAPGQAADRLAAVAQIAGLVVAVERPAPPRSAHRRATRPAAAAARRGPRLTSLRHCSSGHCQGSRSTWGALMPSSSSSMLRSAKSRRERAKQMVGAVRSELTTLSTPC